jgi:hypothetical protein
MIRTVAAAVWHEGGNVMKAGFKSRAVATSLILSMVATPVLAKSAGSLQDLVGARGAGGESQLNARGYEFAKAGEGTSTSKVSYYWSDREKDCVRVETYDGRYTSIQDASHGDCGKSSGNSGAVAAAAIGAVALGAILLSRKDKNRPNNQGYQHDWQQVEAYNLQSGTLRVFVSPDKNSRVRRELPEGSELRNYGCDDYNGESWCEVSTLDNRTRGWARDRYLRPSYGNGYNPGNSYDRGDIVEVYGISSALTISSTPSRNGYVVGRINRGAQLRKSDCQYAGGEQWCRVNTLDGRMYGWARERYLRPVGGGGYNPGGPGYGGGNMGSIYGIQGMDAVRAIDELRSRGFQSVDSFSSGRTLYGIYYYPPTRMCVQTTANNRRILDIRDIRTHPRCR